MDELKRRRIIQNGDTVIFDKGYFSTRNYQLRGSEAETIPIIFPRSNFDIRKAFSKMCYPPLYSRHDFRIAKREYENLIVHPRT